MLAILASGAMHLDRTADATITTSIVLRLICPLVHMGGEWFMGLFLAPQRLETA